MGLIDPNILKDAVKNSPLIDFTDDDIIKLIDSIPIINKCDNCDLMLIAKFRGDKNEKL